ncbi:MAG TPA: hypothetical protein VK469_25020 [Candidatus Kapabacteria bacterium]|nr:hypothetical protein [Candidatus Kapabacteria bacterium]
MMAAFMAINCQPVNICEALPPLNFDFLKNNDFLSNKILKQVKEIK